MKVLGIDIAGSSDANKTWLCDGKKVWSLKPIQLKAYLSGDELPKDVIICWDSPLSVPIYDVKGELLKNAFTSRKIERFFFKNEERRRANYATPRGITVKGYTGVTHWAISQDLLGYPEIGNFKNDRTNHCFPLLSTNTVPKYGRHVVEVHPALAMWLLLRDNPRITNWGYKKAGANSLSVHGWLSPKDIFNRLKELDPNLSGLIECIGIEDRPDIHKDGIVDAVLAWCLGNWWKTAKPKVKVRLVGNEYSGQLLLPDDETIHNLLIENPNL